MLKPHAVMVIYDLYDFGCNPASLFRNIPLFPYSEILNSDAKVIYYIGTAIRANGDLPYSSVY